MHNLFLGALRHNCQDIWEMVVTGESEKSNVQPHPSKEQKTSLNHVKKALEKGSLTPLTKARKGYLVTVAQQRGSGQQIFEDTKC